MKLSIKDLTYRIGDFVILDHVSAEMGPGEIVGLIGPNGAGKSTLADTLSGFLSPSSGNASLNGVTLIGHSPAEIGRRRISRMFQGQHLAWNMSALDNVLVGLDSQSEISWRNNLFATRGASGIENDKRKRALESLGKVGLSAEAERPARDLSFGQQRLLALARAIVHDSKLLLLDEPFTGVKSTALELLTELLRAEARDGRMVLLIDHTLSAVASIATKLWFMEKGQLTVFPDFSSLLNSENFARSYVGLGKHPKQPLAKFGTQSDHVSPVTLPSKSNPIHDVAPVKSMLELSLVSGGYGSRIVVSGVDLSISAGEVVCLLGLNGSGKSTLLRLIAGVTRKFTGSISLQGRNIDHLQVHDRVRRGLRFLTQDHRVFRNLSISENLVLSANPSLTKSEGLGSLQSCFRLLRPNRDAKVKGRSFRQYLNAGGRVVGTLSGGEQAALALEELEFGSAEVILLDEPTSGIDGVTRTMLASLITTWRTRGLAILMAEHDIDFVLSVATKILILRQGRLVPVDPTVSLTPEVLFTIMTEPIIEGKKNI